MFIKKYKHVEDKRLSWEMIKMEIRMFTNECTIQNKKPKSRKMTSKNSCKKPDVYKKHIGTCPTPELIKEYDSTKNKLDKLSFDRTRGAQACVRSKARSRWHEFGERSSKYFLNLEKRNYENKCITSLHYVPGKHGLNRASLSRPRRNPLKFTPNKNFPSF